MSSPRSCSWWQAKILYQSCIIKILRKCCLWQIGDFFLRGPFAGVNLLEKHLKNQSQAAPELHLLHCLELLQHGDKDLAAKALKHYSVLLTEVKASRAHPLYLLARARLADEEEEVWCLVTKFAELYPGAVEKVPNIPFLADVVAGSLLDFSCLPLILSSLNLPIDTLKNLVTDTLFKHLC